MGLPPVPCQYHLISMLRKTCQSQGITCNGQSIRFVMPRFRHCHILRPWVMKPIYTGSNQNGNLFFICSLRLLDTAFFLSKGIDSLHGFPKTLIHMGIFVRHVSIHPAVQKNCPFIQSNLFPLIYQIVSIKSISIPHSSFLPPQMPNHITLSAPSSYPQPPICRQCSHNNRYRL